MTQQIVITLGMRERSHYGKFGQVQINLSQEIDQTFTIVLRLIVESQKDGTLYTDAIIVITLYTFLNIIGRIVYSLVYVPCTSLSRKIKNLGIVFDRMADPLLLKRGYCCKQFLLPLFVLSQGIIYNKQSVIVDACHILHNLIYGPGAEDASTKVADRTGIA